MIINPHIAIIEALPGVGGDEAKIWMKELLLSYIRFAQKRNFKFVYLDDNIVKITGDNAYHLFKNESGVHRVQRIPQTERRGRVHTSTAIIVVLPQIEYSQIKINPSDLEWNFFRSSGHGGQNVNKLETGVRVIHKPTGVIASASRERYQEANRKIALSLLAAKLYQLEEEKRKGALQSLVNNVGNGERAEKIRTYNFPQNRLTDHRINKSFFNLEEIVNNGKWDKIFSLISNKNL